MNDRPELFVKKLHQCAVIFDFNDASSELKGKQIKAAALHEMLDYITTQRGVITEQIYPEVIKMVGAVSIYSVYPFNSRFPPMSVIRVTSFPPICSDRFHHK